VLWPRTAVFPITLIRHFIGLGPVKDGGDYNAIKNFNTLKIVRRIAIYYISPDIVSE
jgi:hypothetical protein